MKTIVCRPRSLTTAQVALATRRSLEINPANADEQRILTRTPVGRRGGPKRLALVIGNRWPKSGVHLSVQFLDNPSTALRTRILLHMNAWSKTANVRFRETSGLGQVRIARLDAPEDMAGYWSWVGTEILGIEDDQPTLNLEGFTMRTSEAEFHRVVRHEAGHTLGFEHEHMRAALVKKIDRRKAFAFYDKDQGWTREETLAQVLTPLAKASIMGTAEADPHSIMCYQIPAEITKDGKAIPGGTDINPTDYAFAAKIYPLPAPHAAPEVVPNSTSFFVADRPAPAADTFELVVLDPFHPDARTASRRERPKFLRIFASYSGARVSTQLRVRAGKGEPPTRFGQIIATHERIKKYTNRDSGSLPDDQRMMEFGSDLFETLFTGDVRRLYDEARSRHQGRKLDLVLTSMVPWIAEKPWEFAYDASRRSFLATEEIHFIRNVLTSVPTDVIPPHRGPLRMLVASAQPVSFGKLSVAQETAVIRRGFQPLIDSGAMQVEILARATPSSIHERLSTGGFNLVHFIGHGVFDEQTQTGSLVFEDGSGKQVLLGSRSVREIFCQRGVRLVFLNSCQSGAGGRADFNQGVAQSLVAHGLPALVANQYSVLDSSATYFAQHFYWALTQGMTIGQAAREARIAVNYSLQGEIIDWAVPVVYVRDPAMTLYDSAQFSVTTPASAGRARHRDQATRHRFKVAVWDIDGVFPAIEPVLVRMTGAQERFDFRLVDVSAPVDAWDLDNRADDGTPYLWAERFADRLARMAMELQVDVLACVTRHWLRDDDYLNIYGWWPERGGPPVLIFSCAGFDELPPEGPDTDRAIVNALVSSLAGYLGGIGAHDRGARSCPMARNGERDFKQLVQPTTFDKGCRAKLKKIPDELRAFEAMLKAFRNGG